MCARVWQVCARALLAGWGEERNECVHQTPCVPELGDAGVEAVECGRHRASGIWEPIGAPGRLPGGKSTPFLSIQRAPGVGVSPPKHITRA